jgi:hypothetical protein
MDWTKVSLGGTIRNHLKKWLENQNWSNNILKPFFQNVFTTFFIIKKSQNHYKFIFLIVMVTLRIMLLNFEKS